MHQPQQPFLKPSGDKRRQSSLAMNLPIACLNPKNASPASKSAFAAVGGAIGNANGAPRVLVTDDDRAALDLLSEVLEKEGYTVFRAESGSEALKILSSQPVDLVLTDLRMREIDGMQVLDQAQTIQKDLPVIVMTGSASIETTIEAIRSGAADYLSKPFKLEHVRSVVRRTLGRISLRRDDQKLHRVHAAFPSGSSQMDCSSVAPGTISFVQPLVDLSDSRCHSLADNLKFVASSGCDRWGRDGEGGGSPGRLPGADFALYAGDRVQEAGVGDSGTGSPRRPNRPLCEVEWRTKVAGFHIQSR